MLIAFCGLDGAGKTTQANSVVKMFESRGLKCGYRHFIKGTLSYYLTHNIVGKVSMGFRSSLEQKLRKEKKGLDSVLLSWVKRLLVLVDVVYFNLRYGNRKGDVLNNIVCDRYYYDELVQLNYLGFKLGVMEKFIKRIMIEPDRIFYIDILPETAFTRKSEGFCEEYFRIKSKRYKDYLPKSTVCIPGDGTEGEIKDIILSEMKKFLPGEH
ncbi:MAG TPA: hypothetical protein PKY78_00945 [Candidatus Omnitrophota bacterium]|nr:hypothetical protein [Candidatus Omnitrophota bacterium]HPS19545.1 hypothetical protein [Candidatus Omnitrophota bacterium]